MTKDLRITQLLCSRLCHDLVGPVGAINNGVELIEDAPELLDESLALLSNSGKQAVRRLAFYRTAFGFGGGDGGGALNDTRRLAEDFLADGNISLEWPESAGGGHTLGKGVIKLLMNIILLGVAALPRGGTLHVGLNAQNDALEVVVTASGQGAVLRDDLRAALASDFSIDDLTAHTVQSQFTTRLAQSVNAEMILTADADEIQLVATVPL